jgi:hypothetical protein
MFPVWQELNFLCCLEGIKEPKDIRLLREINIGTLPSRLGESQQLRQLNIVMSLAGLRPEKDCASEAQQQLKTTDPPSHYKGLPTSTIP